MERMDTIHASTYDREWGVISPTHEDFVYRLLDLTRPKGTVLDAACGTGKYWPLVLDSGRAVVGVDQSVGMLRVAREKHPDVGVAQLGLQELAFRKSFDGVMCIDSLENVGPEDWSTVLARLRDAGRKGTYLYMTVELGDEDNLYRAYEKAQGVGHPVVPGEDFDGVGYHYYPEAKAIRNWLDATGLELVHVSEGDQYQHFLLRRPVSNDGDRART